MNTDFNTTVEGLTTITLSPEPSSFVLLLFGGFGAIGAPVLANGCRENTW